LETKIRILPEFIANQIAAGEVVQRPESVVKELVENSIDSGADSIAVIVKNAGKNLIHIVDNGSGMSYDDLKLSVKRHATSKVFTSEDLESINTFGFRGEALASICSVASMEIRTKTINDAHGWQLLAEPMKTEVVSPISTENGTQIFVRNLFYNVPARRKFLKSDMTEFRYISDTMIKFALSNPNKRFTFYDDNVLIFDVKASDDYQRISDILGLNIANKLLPLNFTDSIIEISGYIGQPELAKMNRSGQYFFLNGRAIFSANLAHSINTVFENLLDRNQKPLFIINLKVDYSKVDVNIHPQKLEVKFEEERHIYDVLKKATQNTLYNHNLIPDITNLEIESPFIVINNQGSRSIVNQITCEIVGDDNKSSKFNFDNKIDNSNFLKQTNDYSPQKYDKITSAFDVVFNKQTKSEYFGDEIKSNQVIQAMGRFILTLNSGTITIYEQSSTHKRIIYNSLKNKEFKPKTQKLLFPLEINLPKENNSFITEYQNILNECGFFFSIINEKIEFYEIPDLVKAGLETDTLNKLIEKIIDLPHISNFDILDSIYKTIADTLSIRTGQILSEEEMLSLINGLEKCDEKYTAPNGNRTFVKLNSEQFYQKFLRL